jgi:polar amino acid transport system substrate-binding protein
MAALAMVLFAIALMAIAGCGSSGADASVSAGAIESEGTQGATGTTTDGPNVAAIKEKGFILIGSSPDFPPYESVDASGKIVGFDVDMMEEIAKRMGVTLQWQDMPFDVTIASLQQGKVDISVSTHQKTPDNSTQVDFTDEYEPATTVFIQRNEDDIKIEKPEDVAPYKVGVQTGGTNEKWLQDHLVTPGLMPAENLLTYERADDSLLDLLNGRLQLITSEGNTGAVYMETKPVKFALITTKMNASNYVIAVPKGWDDLRELFNTYIRDMKADGTMEQLEKKWNLVEPPPGA